MTRPSSVDFHIMYHISHSTKGNNGMKKIAFFPHKYLKTSQMFIKHLGSLNIERIIVEALFCRDVQF